MIIYSASSLWMKNTRYCCTFKESFVSRSSNTLKYIFYFVLMCTLDCCIGSTHGCRKVLILPRRYVLDFLKWPQCCRRAHSLVSRKRDDWTLRAKHCQWWNFIPPPPLYRVSTLALLQPRHNTEWIRAGQGARLKRSSKEPRGLCLVRILDTASC